MEKYCIIFARTIFQINRGFYAGLSNGRIAEGSLVGFAPNSYAIQRSSDFCLHSGEQLRYEWTAGMVKPKWKGNNDVIGCGILLSPANKFDIFFTLNGILMGQFCALKLWVKIH
jgi:hypothetical protein